MTDHLTFQLDTPRLLLKDLTIDDAEALFTYRSLPQVTEFQGWSPTQISDAVKFIEQDICHVLNQPDTWVQLGIFFKVCDKGSNDEIGDFAKNVGDCHNDDKTLIGDVGIHFLPEVNDESKASDSVLTVEIGITIDPSYQGKGYASEAVRRVLDYLFEDLHKDKVIASVDPKNRKSMALMKNVGFQLDGIFPKSVFFRGEWADDAAFSITLEQWRNRLNSNR